MTDAQLKKLAKENNIEPTYELLTFARLVLINAKIKDLKSVAINTRLAVQKEREACAKVAEEGMLLTCKNGAFYKLDGTESTEGLDKKIGSAIAEAIRARGEK